MDKISTPYQSPAVTCLAARASALCLSGEGTESIGIKDSVLTDNDFE